MQYGLLTIKINKMDIEKYKAELEDAIYEGANGRFYIGGKVIEKVLKEVHTQALRIDVVGRSGQLKAFADYAQKRMWEDGDKDLSEFVDEFLRL